MYVSKHMITHVSHICLNNGSLNSESPIRSAKHKFCSSTDTTCDTWSRAASSDLLVTLPALEYPERILDRAQKRTRELENILISTNYIPMDPCVVHACRVCTSVDMSKTTCGMWIIHEMGETLCSHYSPL